MTPTPFWWVWIVAGLVVIMGEFFTPDFYLSCLGVGAVIAGLCGLGGLNIFWQIGAFIVISVGLLPFARKLAKWIKQRTPEGVGSERYMGRTAVVTQDINNLKNTGKVRIEGDEWRAEADDEDEVIPPNEKVVVVSVRGTKLVVRRRDSGERT